MIGIHESKESPSIPAACQNDHFSAHYRPTLTKLLQMAFRSSHFQQRPPVAKIVNAKNGQLTNIFNIFLFIFLFFLLLFFFFQMYVFNMNDILTSKAMRLIGPGLSTIHFLTISTDLPSNCFLKKASKFVKMKRFYPNFIGFLLNCQ